MTAKCFSCCNRNEVTLAGMRAQAPDSQVASSYGRCHEKYSYSHEEDEQGCECADNYE